MSPVTVSLGGVAVFFMGLSFVFWMIIRKERGWERARRGRVASWGEISLGKYRFHGVVDGACVISAIEDPHQWMFAVKDWSGPYPEKGEVVEKVWVNETQMRKVPEENRILRKAS